jgi:hypothetical protein
MEGAGTLTKAAGLWSAAGMANVLSDEKKQQVLALGRLGWSLRKVEEATGVRRETAPSIIPEPGDPTGSVVSGRRMRRHAGEPPLDLVREPLPGTGACDLVVGVTGELPGRVFGRRRCATTPRRGQLAVREVEDDDLLGVLLDREGFFEDRARLVRAPRGQQAVPAVDVPGQQGGDGDDGEERNRARLGNEVVMAKVGASMTTQIVTVRIFSSTTTQTPDFGTPATAHKRRTVAAPRRQSLS